jgi:tetratricopeptide (TPR) repeat protein
MGIARSTYNHEQARSLNLLLDQLRVWELEGLPDDRALGRHTPPPFMAPPGLPRGLIGRTQLIKALKQRLLSGPVPPRLALHGLPGVGKTSLAVELCHDPDVAARFPDGVLWAGLGPDPDLAVQLHLWEIALGFSAGELSNLSRIEDRAQALSAAIGRRHMLLVLDDVWEPADSRLMQLGRMKCGYVFTTRLPTVARELAPEAAVVVPELELAESLQLLARLVPQLSTRLKARGRQIAKAAGGLPLALELLGRSLRSEAYAGRPQRLLEALNALEDPAERLQVEGHRAVSPLQPGQSHRQSQSLASAIALSEEALEPEDREAFVALHVFPSKPASFGESAALAVIDSNVAVLDRLVDIGLVEVGAPDRYRVHQTISDYAALRSEDPGAAHRLVTWAMRFIAEHHADFPALAREIQILEAALSAAHAHGTTSGFVLAVNLLYDYLEASGLLERAEIHLDRAALVATEPQDRHGYAEVIVNLGRTAQRQGQQEQALRRFGQGLELARQLGSVDLECASLQGLGSIGLSSGSHEQARELYAGALTLASNAGLGSRRAKLLSNLGTLDSLQGDAAGAASRYREALSIARTSGDLSLEGTLLTNLGVISAQQGELPAAEAYFEESLEITRAAGNRRATTAALGNLGALAHDQSDDVRGRGHFEAALDMARQIGDHEQITHMLANLGTLATARGDLAQAEQLLDEGLEQARKFEQVEKQILLLINRSQLEVERDGWQAAKVLLDEASALAQELGHTRYQGVIQASLSDLDSGSAESATET